MVNTYYIIEIPAHGAKRHLEGFFWLSCGEAFWTFIKDSRKIRFNVFAPYIVPF